MAARALSGGSVRMRDDPDGRDRLLSIGRNLRNGSDPKWMSECTVTLAVDPIANCIPTLRRQGVIMEADLPVPYGVERIWLNEQVKRNIEHLPADFMFQFTSRKVPLVILTEHRANWLSSARKLPAASMNRMRALRRSSPPTTKPSPASSMLSGI